MTDIRSSDEKKFTMVERLAALGFGGLVHVSFAVAVGMMVYALFGGLQFGYGPCGGVWRWIANSALILQFPFLHSLLLTRRAAPMLDALAPSKLSLQLRPTMYVLFASLQLLLVFLCWSPGSHVLWIPSGTTYYLHCALYVASWLLLGKAMWDGHLGIQTGYIGWTSIWRGQSSIRWPKMPESGLFKVCRQPIYFSFMLTLWTGPVWTVDKLYVALLWTLYCLVGPIFKEKRMSRRFGAEFANYRKRVPYWPGW